MSVFEGVTTEPYVVIVTGWRGARAEAHAETVSEHLYPIFISYEHVVLRHGKCKYGGVDLIADEIGRGWGWEIDAMPAEERDGQILGPARNRAMCAKTPRASEVLAFPGPGSRGTWDCLHWAQRYGIPFRGVGLKGASE